MSLATHACSHLFCRSDKDMEMARQLLHIFEYQYKNKGKRVSQRGQYFGKSFYT